MKNFGNWKLEIGNSREGVFHHAYLIEGVKESILDELHDFFENELKVLIKGNPDFWEVEFDTFGIDDARALKEMQSRKSLGGLKIFIISTNFFTHEAQNSLLKMFEEPTQDTHFFIATGNSSSLLPTLKSRLFILKGGQSKSGEERSLAEKFLANTAAERIKQLKNIIDEKNKASAVSFLNDLEQFLYVKLGGKASKWEEDVVFAFKEIAKARSYLCDRSPSVKMILEHISLVVPKK